MIVDLFGDFKTCFIKLDMRITFASVLFSVQGSSGWPDMRKSILSPRVASGMCKVGGSCRTKVHLRVFAGKLSNKIIAPLPRLIKYQNLRLELVVD